jgi:hypothetical protein
VALSAGTRLGAVRAAKRIEPRACWSKSSWIEEAI